MAGRLTLDFQRQRQRQRGRQTENSNSKTSTLKDSVRSIWTYLTASPCYTAERERERERNIQTEREKGERMEVKGGSLADTRHIIYNWF